MGHSTTLFLLDSMDEEATFVLTQVWSDVIFLLLLFLLKLGKTFRVRTVFGLFVVSDRRTPLCVF